MPAIRQTSLQQLEHMVRFIDKNPTTSGPNNQTQRGKTTHKAWNTLMHQLNALEGNKKSAEDWRKYWRDVKHRTKNKIVEYLKFKRSAKNFATRVPPLDSVQKMIWRILIRDKNKEIQTTPGTGENETDDDSLLTKELGEDSEEVVEAVVMDVKRSPDVQMEDLETQNTNFDFFIVDVVDSEREDHFLDHSQLIQETDLMSERESTNNKDYVKIEEEDEEHNEENEEENVVTKEKYVKEKPHRTRKETHSQIEDENNKPDVEMEIAELQKELIKKQILVEEHKLFQIKLQNEVLKQQLQEEKEKYSHNHMKRLLEKKGLQKIHLDKYFD